MRSFVLLFVFIPLVFTAYSQFTPSITRVDTIGMNYRSIGVLDSVDLIGRRYMVNTPGGQFSGNNGIPDQDIFNNHFAKERWSRIEKVRYTGLPHIGFGYSFGSVGTQIVKFGYEQVFKKNVLVNLDAATFRSNGFIRNALVDQRNGKLVVLIPGKIWSSEILGSTSTLNVGLSNGLIEGNDPNTFSLIFLPVQKENAKSLIRNSNVGVTNYFDFRAKDTTQAFGVILENELRIKDRVYEETDNLSGLYGLINYDSLQTRDKYQWSTIVNGGGLYMKTKRVFAAGLVQYNYWKYYNLSHDLDTIEVNLAGKFNYAFNKLEIKANALFNLIGASNSMDANLLFGYNAAKWKLNSQITFYNGLPDPFARKYYANNINYSWTGTKRYSDLNWSSAFRYESKYPMILTHNFRSIQNGFWLFNNNLSNVDLATMTLNQLTLRSNLSFKGFSLSPSYTYSMMNNGLSMIPAHQVKARMMLKGYVLKAKKMLAFFGADLSYSSSFDLYSYSPVWDSFDWGLSSGVVQGLSDVHLFGGFEIEKFRFFVRFEHLGALWNDAQIEFIDGYTYPEGAFRLGISWDFFN